MSLGLGLGLGTGLGGGGGLLATRDFNFLTSGDVLPSGISLARTDTQTRYRWNSAGLLEPVTSDDPCFQWDSSLNPLGLWIEPAVTQRLLQSNHFDSASWNKFGGDTIATGQADPQGGTAGFTLTESGGGGTHSLEQGDTTAAGTFVGWVLVKPVSAGITGVALRITSNSQVVEAWSRLDLDTPFCYLVEPASVWSNMTCGVKKVGNQGFFLVWVSGTTASAMAEFWMYLIDETGVKSYTGDSTSNILVSNAGLHYGTLPVNPIDTTTGELANAADAVTTTDISWLDTTKGTFVVDHDLPSAGRLLTSGANTILDAPATSYFNPQPRRTLIAYNSGGTTIYDDGVLSSTGGALTFGADLKLLGTVPGHIRRLRWYSQDLSA